MSGNIDKNKQLDWNNLDFLRKDSFVKSFITDRLKELSSDIQNIEKIFNNFEETEAVTNIYESIKNLKTDKTYNNALKIFFNLSNFLCDCMICTESEFTLHTFEEDVQDVVDEMRKLLKLCLENFPLSAQNERIILQIYNSEINLLKYYLFGYIYPKLNEKQVASIIVPIGSDT